MYEDTMTDETPAAYYKRNGPCQHECLRSCSISKECLKQSARLYGPLIERDVRMRRHRRRIWLSTLMVFLLNFFWFVVGWISAGIWMGK